MSFHSSLTGFLLILALSGWSADTLVPDAKKPSGLADLPIREFPSDTLDRTGFVTVIYTGDGGWGETDKGIARILAKRGIGVANINSLLYFRKKRTPESAARDLERIIAHYSAVWQAERFILIGYSFGANVLPFMVDRLSRETRKKIAQVVLISPGYQADFMFHFSSWFGVANKESPQFLPELEKLRDLKVFCFYGVRDKSSSGPQIPQGIATVIPLQTGHRVKRAYGPIVNAIMTEAGFEN